MTDERGYGLVFAFIDQSPSFAHGFTCGCVWERMKTSDDDLKITVLDETVEQIQAIAMHLGWVEEITSIGSGWSQITLRKE